MLIKNGQAKISEYIRADMSDAPIKFKDAMIYGLNSGKRIRSLLVLPLNKKTEALAIEYIHSGLTIMYDMINHKQIRRGMPSLHLKYGSSTAGIVSNLLILRGLKYAGSDEVTRLTQLALEEMTSVNTDTNAPPRTQIEKIRAHVSRMFVIAFLLSDLKIEIATDIGEAFGFCYYLANRTIADETDLLSDKRLVLDYFTENMKVAVTGFTRHKMWTPLLKELTSYILAKFDRNN
jgi:hypothetical protein